MSKILEVSDSLIVNNLKKLKEEFDSIQLHDNIESLTIDLKKCSTIDSTGVGLISACVNQFKNIVIVNVNPDVKAILEVVGITQLIKVEGLL